MLFKSLELQSILDVRSGEVWASLPIPSSTATLLTPFPSRHNEWLIAFWTCFQLETYVVPPFLASDRPLTSFSDIIAADLPHHPLQLEYEDRLPYPDGDTWKHAWLQGDPGAGVLPALAITSYLAQLDVTKRLRQIHRSLYSGTKINQSTTLQRVREAESCLTTMRWDLKKCQSNENKNPLPIISSVPTVVPFDERVPRSTLAATLRAKYWRAYALTYQPCIKLILVEKVMGQDMSRYARKGIKALVESTRAFLNLSKLSMMSAYDTAQV